MCTIANWNRAYVAGYTFSAKEYVEFRVFEPGILSKQIENDMEIEG